MYKFNLAKPLLGKEELLSFKNIINSGWITQGPKTEIFENMIKEKFKCRNVIATNSATSGIIAGLLSLGAKQGDEILTPSNTYVSSINSMYNLKLKIKLCDVDVKTCSVTPEIFEKSISKKTKFFVPVHFGGNPVDLKKILEIAEKKKIKVLDDAAAAIGSKINGKYVGSFKNSISVFSLHANKIITSGEGGFLCLDDTKKANNLRKIINSGIEKSSWKRHKNKKFNFITSEFPGYKFNFNDILAGIAIEQFKKLDKIINYRKIIHQRYILNLNDLFQDNLISTNLPLYKTDSSHYCFQLTINSKFFKRDSLADFLSKKSIQTSIYYTPAHHHKILKKNISFDIKKLKNTEHIFKNSLSLPFHNHLKIKDIDKISSEIMNYFNNDKK